MMLDGDPNIIITTWVVSIKIKKRRLNRSTTKEAKPLITRIPMEP